MVRFFMNQTLPSEHQTSFALWNKNFDLLCINWISMIFLKCIIFTWKKNADKSINPVKKFEKVSMPNLISAQHMRPVRELLKKWLSSLDFFAVHCCKVVTITLSCIFQRLKYWFYPFTYLYFSHKEWRKTFRGQEKHFCGKIFLIQLQSGYWISTVGGRFLAKIEHPPRKLLYCE